MVYELAEALNRFDGDPPGAPPTMTDRAFSRISLTLGMLSAATLAVSALVARFAVPYRDDWDWLNWVLVGPITLRRVFQPHNEHLIPLPRLLSWLSYHVGSAGGHLLFWIAVVAQTATLLLLVAESRRRWRETPILRQALTGMLLLILTFAWQLQSLVFAAAVLFPMVQALAALAVAAAVTASDRLSRHAPRTGWLAMTFGLSLAAMMTTTNGLAVPVVLAILAAARRESRAVILAHTGMILAGGVAFAWLVLSTRAGWSHGALSPAAYVWATLTYFAAFFAPFVTYLHDALGVLVGAALFVAGAALVLRTLRRGPGATRVEHVVAGLLLFTMASGGMAALGRASFGIDQAAQSRYATFALTYWAALLLGFTERRADRLLRPRSRALRATAIAAMVAVIGTDVFTGLVWWAKAGNVSAAGLAVSAGVRDDEWTETLHPLPRVVYDVVALAYANGDGSLLDPAIGTRHATVALPTCGGSLTAFRAPRGEAVRLEGTITDRVTRGVVVDADAVVIGVIRPAPLVNTPNPSRSDVTRAVIRAVRHGEWQSSSWLGFARPSGDPTPTAIFAGADGDVCRIVVTGATGAN